MKRIILGVSAAIMVSLCLSAYSQIPTEKCVEPIFSAVSADGQEKVDVCILNTDSVSYRYENIFKKQILQDFAVPLKNTSYSITTTTMSATRQFNVDNTTLSYTITRSVDASGRSVATLKTYRNDSLIETVYLDNKTINSNMSYKLVEFGIPDANKY